MSEEWDDIEDLEPSPIIISSNQNTQTQILILGIAAVAFSLALVFSKVGKNQEKPVKPALKTQTSFIHTPRGDLATLGVR